MAVCQGVKGTLEFQAGHWPESDSALREAIKLNRQLGAVFGEALACASLGNLLTAQGRLDESLVVLGEGLAAAERSKTRYHALARLYGALAYNRLAAGEMSAAADALSFGSRLSEEHGRCATCETVLASVAVSIRVAQGNLAVAETLCQQLDEAAARYGGHNWQALAGKARAELAEAQGDRETAVTLFQQAHDDFRIANNEFAAAQCEAALAHYQ